jgi:SAUR family protein
LVSIVVVNMAVSKKLTKLAKKCMKAGTLTDTLLSSTRNNNGTWRGGHMNPNEEEEEEALDDVPAGCLAIYVGEERRRFVIETDYLKNHVFRALLAKSEEEFGFEFQGGLRLACCPDVFEHLMWWLEGSPAHSSLRMEPWWS